MASRGADRDLSDKQKRFVDEYVLDMNATQAAKRAGYSPKSAEKIGFDLLRIKLVQDKIKKKVEKVANKVGLTKERILAEYQKIAFSNMVDFADWHANGVDLRDSKDLRRSKTAAISEVSETVNNAGHKAVKIKLHDKKGALDSLAKHMGLLIDKTELTGKDGMPLHPKEPEHDLSKLTQEELELFKMLSEKAAVTKE